MYTNFESLPENSRVWVFQTSKPLTSLQKEIEKKAISFLDTWEAHQKSLKASICFKYDRFIILAMDENHNKATGCSVDKMTHFVQSLEKEMDLSLFDRSILNFLIDDSVVSFKIAELKDKVASGELVQHTKYFDNTVDSLKALKERWLVDASESWLNRYF